MSRTLNQAGHGATDECAARHGPRITANDLTELGIYVIALALFYGSLGIILFFDRGLLAFSNVRCLCYSVFSHLATAAIPLWLPTRNGTACECHVLSDPIEVRERAPCRSIHCFRIPQTAAFFVGIALILMGWTFSGFFIEIFGFVFLYRYDCAARI